LKIKYSLSNHYSLYLKNKTLFGYISALPKTGLFAVKAKTPVAPVPAESSAERPIETRKSFSTPRRDSSYVRTLDFSTPPQNKVAARRALTSPKVIKPRGGFASAKHLSTAAKIVRSGLFDKVLVLIFILALAVQ